MRISSMEMKAIAKSTREFFGPLSVVKLFGSRIDDRKRGGDIDLLILVPERELDAAKSRKFQFIDSLQNAIGEQRIDVVITTAQNMEKDEFLQSLDSRVIPET